MKVHLNQFKFPIEYMFLGIIPKTNQSGAYEAQDWHRFTKVDHKKSTGGYTPKLEFADVKVDDGLGGSVNQTLVVDSGYVSQMDRLNYDVAQPVIDHLTVTAHGLALYQKLPAQFYNQHIPGAFS